MTFPPIKLPIPPVATPSIPPIPAPPAPFSAAQLPAAPMPAPAPAALPSASIPPLPPPPKPAPETKPDQGIDFETAKRAQSVFKGAAQVKSAQQSAPALKAPTEAPWGKA